MNARLAAALLCLATLFALTPASHAQVTAYTRIWDLATQQEGQLTVYNADDNGGALGMPVGSGNLDGADDDGVVRGDVVLAPFYAFAGPGNGREGAGKLHVYFGTSHIGGTIEDPTNGPAPGSVEIWGARAGDFLGSEVDVADVSGDGLDEILACAENADGFGASVERPQAGSLYVIAGRSTWPSTIDLASPDANTGVMQILGAHASPDQSGFEPGDRLGFWATAGDVTGDGVKDILVSADLYDGPTGARSNSGALYVIPGGSNITTADGSLIPRLDLANPGSVKVFVVYGIDTDDHLGSCIASADFDGDGIADVAVSSAVNRAGASYSGYGMPGAPATGGGDGPNNARRDVGDVYIVYGRSLAQWEATPAIQLTSASTPDVTTFYGENEAGYFGEDLAAGDFDGDGKTELVVGALTADAPFPSGSQPVRYDSGAGYVFWGANIHRGDAVDLATTHDASKVTRIYGEFSNDIGADSIRLADVDADGKGDLFFGSPLNPTNGAGGPARPQAGDLKLIFGKEAGLPAVIDLRTPPSSVQVFQIAGAERGVGSLGDLMTYSLAFGDFDGDGFVDILPNSMGADGAHNAHPESGELAVISGRTLSGLAGRLGADNPTLTNVSANGSDPYYAGQPGVVLVLTGTGFAPSSRVVIRGVEVPAAAVEVVGPTEIRVSLDAAPEVRNAPGVLVVQVVNPDGGVTQPVSSIRLLGPTIAKVKVKRTSSVVTLNVKGTNFRDGVTVDVRDGDGTVIAATSVERPKPGKLRVRLAAADVPHGATLTVVVVNPGPAPSDPTTVHVP